MDQNQTLIIALIGSADLVHQRRKIFCDSDVLDAGDRVVTCLEGDSLLSLVKSKNPCKVEIYYFPKQKDEAHGIIATLEALSGFGESVTVHLPNMGFQKQFRRTVPNPRAVVVYKESTRAFDLDRATHLDDIYKKLGMGTQAGNCEKPQGETMKHMVLLLNPEVLHPDLKDLRYKEDEYTVLVTSKEGVEDHRSKCHRASIFYLCDSSSLSSSVWSSVQEAMEWVCEFGVATKAYSFCPWELQGDDQVVTLELLFERIDGFFGPKIRADIDKKMEPLRRIRQVAG